MRIKTKLMSLILILTILCILPVSMATNTDDYTDLNETNINHTHTELSNINKNPLKLKSANDEELNNDSTTYTYTDLKNIITNAIKNGYNELNLTHNYTFNLLTDSSDSIIINKAITINGNNYTLDGNSQGSLFNITGANVTINNIIFSNHIDNKKTGVVIYWLGANGKLLNSNFYNNKGLNGIVSTIGANITIKNCTFTCIASDSYGGSLYINSTNAIIDNCKFINCSAYSQYIGGAITTGQRGNNISITNSIFINNTERTWGGSIYIYGNGILIDNCSFINSHAGYGGALYSRGDNVIVNNSNFINSNATSDGGAIYILTGSNFTILNSNFINCTCNEKTNTSYSGGGAIRNSISSTYIYNSTFINCSATHYGGVIYTGSSINISDCSFINSHAEYGGVIYHTNYAKNTTIKNSIFSKNTATYGQSIYLTISTTVLILDDCIFTDNETVSYFDVTREGNVFTANLSKLYYGLSGIVWGQGLFNNIYFNGHNPDRDFYPNPSNYGLYFREYNLENKTVVIQRANNGIIERTLYSPTGQDGILTYTANKAGIYTFYYNDDPYYSRKTFNLTDFTDFGEFYDYTALKELIETTMSNGETILNLEHNYTYDKVSDSDFTPIEIKNTLTINGNSYTLNGEGQTSLFNISGANVILKDINIINHKSDTESIIYWSGTNGKILNSNFTNNIGNYGIIYGDSTNLNISNTLFKDNTAKYGGGVYFGENSYNSVISNSNFTNNTAIKGSGIYLEENVKLLNLNNNTFSSNTAELNGLTLEKDKFQLKVKFNTGDNLINAIYTNIYNDNLKINGIGIVDINNTLIYTPYHKDNEIINIEIYDREDNLVSNTTKTLDMENTIYYTLKDEHKIRFIHYPSKSYLECELIYERRYDFTALKELIEDTLESGYNELNLTADYSFNISTDLQETILINKPLTINGNNHTLQGFRSTNYELSHNIQFRMFEVTGDNVIFNNITFYNFSATNLNGSLFYWNGSNGVINNSVFFNASAKSGVFYSEGVNLTISNSYFKTIYSEYYGGAIYLSSKTNNTKILNCTFDTTYNTRRLGGAIYVGGNNTLIDSVNFRNTEGLHGGAIGFDENGTNLIISNCNFNISRSAYGGAIYSLGSNLYIYNSNFNNSYGVFGGGVIYSEGQNSNLTIFNSTFRNGTATVGGILYIGSSFENVNITNSTFSNGNCYSGGNGGIIYFTASSTNCIIDNSKFMDSNPKGYGGALYFNSNNSTILINNSFFTRNNGTYGAVAYFTNGNNNVLILNSNFTNNTGVNGGVFYFTQVKGNYTIFNSNFINNSATYGGAIYFSSSQGFFNISNSTFKDNTAKNGSAIYNNYNKINLTLNYNNFTYNLAEIYDLKVTRIGDTFNITLIGGDNLINSIYTIAFNEDFKINTETINTKNEGIIYNTYHSSNPVFNIEVYDSTGDLVSNTTNLTNMDGSIIYTIGDEAKVRFIHYNGTGYGETEITLEFGYGYSELKTLIEEALNEGLTELNITHNYVYNIETDTGICPIIINKPLIINGNGHTLNGLEQTTLFNITGDNVVLNNITIINHKGNLTNPFIEWLGDNGVLNNSNLKTNGYILIKGDNIEFTNNNFNINSKYSNFTVTSKGLEYIVNLTKYLNITSILYLDSSSTNFKFNNENPLNINNELFITDNSADTIIMDVYGENSNLLSSESKTINSSNLISFTPEDGVKLVFYLENTPSKSYTFYISYDYTRLKDLIEYYITNNKTVLNLTHDFVFNQTKDKTNYILINKSITINGAKHILDGMNLTPLFNITASNVILNNLTIINHCNLSTNSPIIWEASGTLNNTIIRNNNAINGIISLTNGNFNIISSSFIENTVKSNGGALNINNTNTVTILDSSFINNNADTGAAIYINNATSIILNNNQFNNNHAGITSLNITKTGRTYTATLYGKNNILNAVYTTDLSKVEINNNPIKLSADLSNNGALEYGDTREYGQEIKITVYDKENNIIHNTSTLTDIYGAVSYIPGVNAYKIVFTHENNTYYDFIENTVSNIPEVYIIPQETTLAGSTLNIKIIDTEGNLISGNLTVNINNTSNSYITNGNLNTINAPEQIGEYWINLTFTDKYGNTIKNNTKFNVSPSNNVIINITSPLKGIFNENITVEVNISDIYGNIITNGNITIQLNGTSITHNITNNNFNITLPSTEGEYNLTVTYTNPNKEKTSLTVPVNVSTFNGVNIGVDNIQGIEGESINLNITVKENTGLNINTGNITLSYNGINQTVNIKNGTANFTIILTSNVKTGNLTFQYSNYTVSKIFNISAYSSTSYTALKNLIETTLLNNLTVLNLNSDYTFNSTTDSINYIIINKTLTINGNNHTLNGLNQGVLFKITGDNVVLNNLTITNHRARTGINIILWDGNNGELLNSKFTNTNYFLNGIPFTYTGNNSKIINTSFINNTGRTGGLLQFINVYNLTIINSEFINSTTTEGNGGGITINGGGNITIINTTFTSSKTSNCGGGLYINDLTGLKIINSTFTNNSAINGSAIYINSGENIELINNTFKDNHAEITSLIVNKTNRTYTATLIGNNNLLNAIYTKNTNTLTINGIRPLSLTDYINNDYPYFTTCEYNQRINITVYDVNNNIIYNTTRLTDIYGTVSFTPGFNAYKIVFTHENDAYYSTITNTSTNIPNLILTYDSLVFADYNFTINLKDNEENSINANVSIKVNNTILNYELKNGTLTIPTIQLGDGGLYNLNITLTDEYNNNITSTNILRIYPKNKVNIKTLEDLNFTIAENTTITIEITDTYNWIDLTKGNITIQINNTNITQDISNKTFNIIMPNTSGTYNLTIIYTDTTGNTVNETLNLTINPITEVIIELDEEYYDFKGETIEFIVEVENTEGVKINTGTLSFTYDNNNYISNVKNGIATFTVPLTITSTNISIVYSLTSDSESFNIYALELDGYTALLYLIEDALDEGLEEVTLTKDYKYYIESDVFYPKEGIRLNEEIKINGNNHTLNGEGQVRLFYIREDNIVLSNLRIINHTGDDGGAIYIEDDYDYIIINNTYFGYNTAETGGALYIDEDCNNIIILNSKFEFNTAETGGAIYIYRDCYDIEITGTNFVNCSSTDEGGAIYIRDMTDFIFENNTFINCSSLDDDGGALYLEDCEDGIILNSTFISNFASYNGASIYLDYGSNINILNSQFINSQSDTNGGAIYYDCHDNSIIENSTFINSNSEVNGGVIYFDTSDNIVLNNNKFINSTAENYGGALYIIDSNSIDIVNSSFLLSNGKSGGAIYTTNSLNINIFNSSFINSYASDCAGAAYIEKTNNSNIYNTSFINSTAVRHGGAVMYSEISENGFLDNCKFINNTAGNMGGGLYYNIVVNMSVYNSQFINNYGEDGGAIGIVSWTGEVSEFENNTFINNTAINTGSAIKILKFFLTMGTDNFKFNNNTFKDNHAGVTSLTITKDGRTYTAILNTKNNIENAFHVYSANILTIDGKNIVSLQNSNNGELPYLSTLKANELIQIEVYDKENNLIDNRSTLTNLTGEVSYTPGVNAYKIVFTHKNTTYYDYIANEIENIEEIYMEINGTLKAGDSIGIKISDLEGNLIPGNITINIDGNISTIEINGTLNLSSDLLKLAGEHEINLTFKDLYGNILVNNTIINISPSNNISIKLNTTVTGIYNENKNITVNITDIYGNKINTGNITLILNNSNIKQSIDNSTFLISLPNTPGDYNLTVIYTNNLDENTSSNFTINVRDFNGVNINPPVVRGVIGTSSTFTVEIKEDSGEYIDLGNLTLTYNGFNQTVNISDGKATFTVILADNTMEANLTFQYFNSIKVKSFNITTYGLGSYTVLKNLIDNAIMNNILELNLSSDYSYDPILDNFNQIEINKSLTINGNGHTLNGMNLTRLFYITGDNVVLKDLVIINHNTSSMDGSSIYWKGDNGKLIASVIKDNFAYSGAVYIKGVNVSIVNTSFINNKARSMGGALKIDGSNGLISNCVFINNTVLETSTGSGGAIYLDSYNFTIVNSVFINSSAYSQGGSIVLLKSGHNLTNISFLNSRASLGGAILLGDGGNSLISNSNFYNNFAESAGGALFYFLASNVTVCNSSFINNSASVGGAIIFSTGSSNSSIFNSSFFNNSAISSGSAIRVAVDDKFVFTNNIFQDNHAGIISLNITNLSRVYTATLYGKNNIFNGISAVNPSNLIINGQVPVSSADESNNGLLIYSDIREANQSINLTVFDKDDNLIYSTLLLTDIYGSVSFIPGVNAYKLVFTHENNTYYDYISSSISNIPEVSLNINSTSIIAGSNITVNLTDTEGNLISGTLFVNISNFTSSFIEDGVFNLSSEVFKIAGNHSFILNFTDTYGNSILSSQILKVSPTKNTVINISTSLITYPYENLTVNLNLTDEYGNNISRKVNITVLLNNTKILENLTNTSFNISLPSKPGTYNLTIISTNELGEQTIKTFNLTIKPFQNITITTPTIQGNNGSTINITVNITSNNTNINYGNLTLTYNGINQTYNITNGYVNFTITLSDSKGTLTFTDGENTKTTILNLNITNTNPTLTNITISIPLNATISENLTFNISHNLENGNITIILNNTNTSGNINDEFNIIAPETPGTYNLTIIYTNETGNTIEETYNFTVSPITSVSIIKPTISGINGTSISFTINLKDNNGRNINTGNLTLTYNNINQTVKVINGLARFTVNLNENTGVLKYTTSNLEHSENININVINPTNPPVNPPINPPIIEQTIITIPEITLKEGEKTTISIRVFTGTTGENGILTTNLDGTISNTELTNGIGNLELTNLTSGQHQLTVTYNGNTETKIFTVLKDKNITINTEDISLNPNTNETINIKIDGAENGTITVIIDNTTYTGSVTNGTVSLNITSPTKPGTYNVTIIYTDGTDKIIKYKTLTVHNTNPIDTDKEILFNITTTLLDPGVETTIPVYLNYIDGVKVNSGNVTLILNGGNYTGNVINGTAYVNISSPNAKGLYNLTVLYNNGVKEVEYNTNISVGIVYTIVTLTDLTKYYGEPYNLTGTITDSLGNPLMGHHIKLKMIRATNGQSKIYDTVSDFKGVFSLVINLAPGLYYGEANYTGANVRGIEYLPGFDNATVRVLNPDELRNGTILTVYKFNETYGAGKSLTGVLTDLNGIPIPGMHVASTLTRLSSGASKTYDSTTDYTGTFRISINLAPGEYLANCAFDGISKYAPSSSSNTITVTRVRT